MKEKIFVKSNLPYLAVAVVLAIALLFSLSQLRSKNRYAKYLNNNYQASLHNAVSYADNVDNLLEKVLLADSAKSAASLFAELYRQASAAHDSISALPYHQEMVSQSLVYLSQVADLSYTLLNKTIDGGRLSQEDKENLEKLKEYSSVLSGEMNVMLSKVNLGNSDIQWAQVMTETPYLYDTEDGRGQRKLLGSMIELNKEFQQYPSLIYDGPFSEHIKSETPKQTQGASLVTAAEGKIIILDFLSGYNIDDIIHTGSTALSADVSLPVHSYDIILAGDSAPTLSIDITQEGGYPLWMLNYTKATANTSYISVEKAVKLGEKFLLDAGYEHMQYSYYEVNNDTVAINFAPVINSIIHYPDLVKVKVSLVNGTVLGFDAGNYIYMHHDRGELYAGVTMEDAMKSLPDGFEIKSTAYALIPLETKEEKLCYEFRGSVEGSDYIIYVDAATGKQQDILKLEINEQGVLAW